MSTLKLVSRSNTQAVYTTNAVLGNTNRLRLGEALEMKFEGRYLGYSVAPRTNNTHEVTVLLAPEAV